MFNSILQEKVFIIAEAGVNHNGNFNTAVKLIDIAVNAGADAVKFQTFKAENIVTRDTSKADYQKVTTGSRERQFDMLKRLELSEKEYLELSLYCKHKGILFMSTPFDLDSVDLLETLNMPIYKISSGDITNYPLLKKLARLKKPMIISTGMSNIEEVKEANEWIIEEGNEDVVFLHCTTEYPAKLEGINLNAMNTLQSQTKRIIGYSDHSEGIEVALAAVALGARVVEKHFTIDRKMDGPDHRASIEPKELVQMVQCIRNIEKALGNSNKLVTEDEQKNKIVIRKSIIAKSDLKRGDTINFNNIIIKRPGTGIHPKDFYNVIGMKVNKDIKYDQVLKWEDIEGK